MDEIIFKIMLPLTYFDEEDERLWEEDPLEYVKKVCNLNKTYNSYMCGTEILGI